MNLALQTKESYAILMDKFRAYQYLSSGLYPRLKIYSSVERPIEYAVAVDNTKLKDNPLDSMCLERIWRESHEQADSLVFSYIERLTGKVWNRFKGLFSTTIQCNHLLVFSRIERLTGKVRNYFKRLLTTTIQCNHLPVFSYREMLRNWLKRYLVFVIVYSADFFYHNSAFILMFTDIGVGNKIWLQL